jgi:hypothetical protein
MEPACHALIKSVSSCNLMSQKSDVIITDCFTINFQGEKGEKYDVTNFIEQRPS